MRAPQAKGRRRKGIIVDLGTTLEERFPKEETYRTMTPRELVEFCRCIHDSKQLKESVERRLINARTLVLMAACAFIPQDGGISTEYQAFLSLEKAVLEYRAAVRQDERFRGVKVT